MHILAIECTHVSLSVALGDGDDVTLISGAEWNRAAETILPLVQELFLRSGTPKERLDAVAISSGPGSFTALRIGMSAAKGLAYGLGIPLVAVPTLHAMALSSLPRTATETIVPVIPARKGEYHFACYRRGALEARSASQESCRGSAEAVLTAAGTVVGTATVVARQSGAFPMSSCARGTDLLDADFFSAASLLPEAKRLFMSGVTCQPADAEPEYRQMFVPGHRKE